MPSSTEDPVVFITGCSNGGIGSALAKVFAERGCIVYATARTLASMSELIQPNVRKLALDVTEDSSVKSAVDEVYETAHRIDILVSNAGLPSTAPLLDVSFEEAQRVFDTNFWGMIRLVTHIVPRMAKRRQGTVIAVGSILGEIGTPFQGFYNASKAALHAYTETLTDECKPLGVKVMLLVPGSIRSNISTNSAKTYHMPENSLYKDYVRQIEHIRFQSQMPEYGVMPTMDFANKVVDKALAKDPPRYYTLGGSTRFWAFLKWLPRTFALNLIWNALSKPPKK